MTNNPFAHPSGWRGRMAGKFMLWTNKQDDVIGILEVQPGHDVLEIGYGPGGLIRLLVERTDAASIRGVDPSPEMRDQASWHNRKAVRAGRVRLDVGTAARTGLPDASVDRVVSGSFSRPMTVISSRSTTTVGSLANQASGSRPANQSAALLASGCWACCQPPERPDRRPWR